MLYLQLWFVVFFGLVEKSMSMEQDQFCQLKAIQECLYPSLGLLEAIESGNEPLSMKECDLLQVRPASVCPISSNCFYTR